MSNDEPTNGGEMIPASGGVPGHLAKGLIDRIRGDIRASSKPVPVSEGQCTELESSGSWHCKATLGGHSGPVYRLAVSRGGTLLATGDCDGNVRLWAMPEGLPMSTVEVNRDAVRSLAITPDDRILISGHSRASLNLWSLPGGELLNYIERAPFTTTVECLAVSPDGKLLASGGSDGVVHLWGLPEGVPVATTQVQAKEVSCLAISPDSRFLASGHGDGSVRLWNLPGGGPVNVLLERDLGVYRGVRDLIWTPDGRLLVGCKWFDKCVYICDFPGKTIRVLIAPDIEGVADRAIRRGGQTNVAVSPNCRLLVSKYTEMQDSGDFQTTVHLWSLPDGNALRTLQIHDGCVTMLISPNGRFLVCNTNTDQSANKLLYLLRLPEGEHLTALEHTCFAWSLAMTPDRRLLISGGDDGAVRLWGT
jgi:WD40 repeat protein